eukprot:6491527-Amphidinium_carterae.1
MEALLYLCLGQVLLQHNTLVTADLVSFLDSAKPVDLAMDDSTFIPEAPMSRAKSTVNKLNVSQLY